MQSQISNLVAILNAGLTHKVVPGADLSKADWDKLLPFIEANHLQCIAAHACAVLKKLEQPLPERQVVAKLRESALRVGTHQMGQQIAIKRMAREWREAGKCPLALGGVAFSVFYPSYVRRGGDTLVCIPLHQKVQDGKAQERLVEQREGRRELLADVLKVTVPESAIGSFEGSRGDEADAILRSAFYAGPCELHPGLGIAYPAPAFLALYHLYTAQQLLLNTHVPFDMVIDWGAMLHGLGVIKEDKFSWTPFLEQLTDLGLLSFAQAFTALAVRLTGITLPEAAASLTATDEDVDYLFNCILDETSAKEVADGRFSRFFDVLRNSKKYSRFSESSPLSEAFHYLFK